MSTRTLDPEAQERMFLAVGRTLWALAFVAGWLACLGWQWLAVWWAG